MSLISQQVTMLRDCNILYVNYDGDLEEIKTLAAVNNNRLTKLSQIDFDYYVRRKR